VTIKAFDYSDEECEPSDTATGYSVMCCGDERPVVRTVSTKSCSELADSDFRDTPFGRIDVCGSSTVVRAWHASFEAAFDAFNR
jgi:hypothetical protein